MSAIHTKSLTGITSITTPPGVDNVFTVHSNDTTERFRIDQTGNQSIAGILTVAQDLDVDGHTNLDNVSVAGLTTTNSLHVAANNTTVGVAITQSGSGDILKLYDGTAEVFTVANQDEGVGAVTISSPKPRIVFNETNGSPDYQIRMNGGIFTIHDSTNDIGRISITSTRTDINNPVLLNNDTVWIGDKLVHWTDDDTAIRFPSANTFSVETGGNERFRIASDGQNTIKSGAHDKGLDILPVGNQQETRLRIQAKNSSGTEHTFTLGAKQSGNRMDIYGTGPICFLGPQNVGIHNTVPTSPLHVGDDTNPHTTKALLFVGPASGDGTFHLRGGSPTVFFDSTSGGDAKILLDGRDLIIRDGTFDSAGSELLRISSAGYVGINQSSPQTGLHINQDWVNSYGSISVEGSANALVGLGLRSNGNYRASLIWRDGSSGNYLDIATYGAAYPILFRPNGTEKVRITGGGDLEMTGGTVSLKEHMVRVGNRTTSQINAGVSTSTGSVTLDTTTNNLLYYANAQWNTVKKVGNDGSTQQLAARSAKALLDDGITANGVYWLDMHGAYSLGNAKLHYCLMDSSYDGGGWTMLYSMNHGNNFASGSNYSFSVNVGNPTTINDFTAGNWGYDRRNTFTPAANDQFLIRRSDNNDWKRFVVSNWSPTANSVSNGWETLRLPNGSNTGHPQWATGQMYDSSGNAVSGHIYFNGCAMGGNCNSGGGDGSGFGNYSQWLDAVGNSAFGGGYNSQSNGGSPLYWGQGNALSQGGSLYIQMFYRKAGTQ